MDSRSSDYVKGVHMCQMQSMQPGDIILVRSGASDSDKYRCVVSFSNIPPIDMKEIVFYPLVVTDGKQASIVPLRQCRANVFAPFVVNEEEALDIFSNNDFDVNLSLKEVLAISNSRREEYYKQQHTAIDIIQAFLSVPIEEMNDVKSVFSKFSHLGTMREFVSVYGTLIAPNGQMQADGQPATNHLTSLAVARAGLEEIWSTASHLYELSSKLRRAEYVPVSDRISAILMELVRSSGSGAPKIPGKDLVRSYKSIQLAVDEYVASLTQGSPVFIDCSLGSDPSANSLDDETDLASPAQTCAQPTPNIANIATAEQEQSVISTVEAIGTDDSSEAHSDNKVDETADPMEQSTDDHQPDLPETDVNNGNDEEFQEQQEIQAVDDDDWGNSEPESDFTKKSVPQQSQQLEQQTALSKFEIRSLSTSQSSTSSTYAETCTDTTPYFDHKRFHCTLHSLSIKPYHSDKLTLQVFSCPGNRNFLDECIRCVWTQATEELEAKSKKEKKKKKDKLYELSNSNSELIIQVLSIIQNLQQVVQVKSLVNCITTLGLTNDTNSQSVSNGHLQTGDILLTINKGNVLNKKVSTVGDILVAAVQKSIATKLPVLIDLLRITTTDPRGMAHAMDMLRSGPSASNSITNLGTEHSPAVAALHSMAFSPSSKSRKHASNHSGSKSSAKKKQSYQNQPGDSDEEWLSDGYNQTESDKDRHDMDEDDEEEDYSQHNKRPKISKEVSEREEAELAVLRQETFKGRMVFAFQTEWAKEYYPAIVVDIKEDMSQVQVKWDSNGQKQWIPLVPKRIQVIDIIDRSSRRRR